MEFIISANTDVGTVKLINQDSLTIKLISTKQGKMVFSVLCDGLGGLAIGEVASASVVRAFEKWVYKELPLLCSSGIEDTRIRSQWENIVSGQNNLLKEYGARHGVKLGTTVIAMLLTQTRYYILNVGDSRAYELKNEIRQLTVDQTFVAQEIARGHMTKEQAKTDSRRNVLLQCVGASEEIYPDLFFGEVKRDAAYLLCSDGFRHEVTPEEIFYGLMPAELTDEYCMKQKTTELIETAKQRGEKDNISAALVRTF